jgi:polysaccharide biosynthesis transport protein
MNTTNEPTIDLSDYWAIVVRRKFSFLLPFAVVFGISLALAFLLPATYRSEATILIQRQAIPKNLVETTITGYIEEQIQEIEQRIKSYANLLDIAEAFDLYPGERQANPSGVVTKVASNIEVEMVDVKASSPDNTGDRNATIAFTVAFNASTAETARAVTEALAKRYLDEHKASREAQAAQVSAFLEAEADKLKSEIATLEKAQADFKQREQNQLPEVKEMNLGLFERTQQEIDQSKTAIRSMQERIDAGQSELSLTDPYKEVVSEDGKRVLSATERLSLLTAQYLQASARYSPEHPDVLRLAREIRVLADQTGTGARADELMGQLTALQEQLRQARQKYSPDHPEVQKLEKAVTSVERGFQGALISGKGKATAMPPDNPRYVALKTQVDADQSNLQAENQKLATLEKKLVEYQDRLFKTPLVDRDYKTLNRDYENAVQKYNDLKTKQLQARMAQQLESGDNAEQFVLLSGAYLPSMPTSPNRIGILLLGALLAIATGIGFVAVFEHMDQTVRDGRTVASIFGAPPMAIIPQMGLSRSVLRRTL